VCFVRYTFSGGTSADSSVFEGLISYALVGLFTLFATLSQVVRQLILLFETAYARNAEEVSVPGVDGRRRPIAYDIMSRMGGLPTLLTLLRSLHLPWQR
jgi:hypothetical protein